MAECECLEGCPFFNSKVALMVPQETERAKQDYCLGDNTYCARHMILTAIGKTYIPDDLVPTQLGLASRIIRENTSPA